MTDASMFRLEQRRVATGMTIGFFVSLTAMIAAISADRAHGILSLQDRLPAFARAEFFVVIWLVAMIANVARMRFFSVDDIAGSSSTFESQRVEDARAVLQNTLEQVVLGVACHALLLISVPNSTYLVAVLAALFSVGRLFFWIGHSRGAAARSLGFALTFYPSLLCLVFVGARLFGNV